MIFRRAFSLGLAVLVLGSLVPGGVLSQSDDVAEPTADFMITQGSSGGNKPFEAFDAVTLAAFDLDGDGVKEIIAHNDNNNLYVFDGETGGLIAELVTDHPKDWGARELAGPAVGDVNGNGVMDIVVTNSAGWLTAFETQVPKDPEGDLGFEKLWEIRMDPRDQDPDYLKNHPWAEFNGHPGLDGSPYLADVTGSGGDEIFLQLDDMPGLYALNGDGEVTWWTNWTEGNSNPVATDITGEGDIQVMYPSDGGQILVFDAQYNYNMCKFNARDYGADPGSISVAPTVVDLTGDGAKEIVFGVRHAIEDEDDPEWYLNQSAHYFALTSDCELLWHQSWEWSNPHVHMHPVPVDVTGNGQLDVIFQDWNTVGHKPGDWQETGDSNLFAVEGRTGNVLWQRETDSYWSNKNLAVADVTGDGEEEILVVEPRGGQGGVMLYDLHGSRKGFIQAPSGWSVTRGAAVSDLDGDGNLDVIVPVHRAANGCTRDLDVGCREGALQVYKTSGSGEPTWSGVKAYNHRFDDERKSMVPPSPDVEVSQVEAEPGHLALDVSAEASVEGVHVRVPGTQSWQPIEHDGGDRFESSVAFGPAPGDEVLARVYLSDGRLAFTEFVADGDPVMLEVAVVGPDSEGVGGAQVIVENETETVWKGTATADGLVRIGVPPDNYSVKAAQSGYRDASEHVVVGPEGVTEVTLEMSRSFGVWMGVGAFALALAGAVVAGVVFKRRRAIQ